MRLKALVWYLSWEWVGEVSLLLSPRVMQRNWRIGEWECVTECVCERGEMESQAGLGSSGAQRVRESWRMNRVRYFRVLLFRPNGAFCTFFFLIGRFSANTVFFSWFSAYREWKKKRTWHWRTGSGVGQWFGGHFATLVHHRSALSSGSWCLDGDFKFSIALHFLEHSKRYGH